MKKFFIIFFMGYIICNSYSQDINSCINISQECVERNTIMFADIFLGLDDICPQPDPLLFSPGMGVILECFNCEVSNIVDNDFGTNLTIPIGISTSAQPFLIKFTGDRSKCHANLKIKVEKEWSISINISTQGGTIKKIKPKYSDGKTISINNFNFSLEEGVCDILRVSCNPPKYKVITNCSSNPAEQFSWSLNGSFVGNNNSDGTIVINHGPNDPVQISLNGGISSNNFTLSKHFSPLSACNGQITGDIFLSSGAVGTFNLTGGTLTNVYIASGRGSVRKTSNQRFEYTPPSGNQREKVRICANYLNECGYSCVICKDIFINWDVKTGDDPIGGGRFGENNDSSSSKSNLNDDAVRLNISDYKIVYNADEIYLENISKDTKIFLTDIMGRVVYSGNNTNVIPLNNINTGIYFLVLQNNTEKILDTRKVFIP